LDYEAVITVDKNLIFNTARFNYCASKYLLIHSFVTLLFIAWAFTAYATPPCFWDTKRCYNEY